LIAEPIYVPSDSTSEVEVRQAALQRTLERLRSEGEDWRLNQG
jgi:hypothetical protein